MAELYGPFDGGAGASMREDAWRKMAQLFAPNGALHSYLNGVAVYADSTGMQVKVRTGLAFLVGHFYENTTEVTLPIATANPSNPRIDRVCLVANFAVNTILLTVLSGTPAASPVPPFMVQGLSTLFVEPLAQVRVEANVTTIAADKVTDERRRTGAQGTLAWTSYDPAAGTLGVAASGVLWQVPDPALVVSFFAPPSGSVKVVLTADAIDPAVAGHRYWWGVTDSVGLVAGSSARMSSGSGASGTQWIRRTHSFVITGLAQATRYTWSWAHRSEDAADSGAIGFGGSGNATASLDHGPALMEVYGLP